MDLSTGNKNADHNLGQRFLYEVSGLLLLTSSFVVSLAKQVAGDGGAIDQGQ